MPTQLEHTSLISAFKQHGDRRTASPETATRRGGVRSTLMLIGVDGHSLRTASAMRPSESMTANGRAAWRRQRRLAYYLWQSVQRAGGHRRPVLLLAELDDVADGLVSDGTRGLPKLSSSSGACGMKLAVPILLKGFGSTDFERWLASSRAKTQLGKQSTPPWDERLPRGVWRGSSRTVLPEETCSATPDFSRWAAHPRGKLVSLARRHPALLDADYTELEKIAGGNSTPVRLRSSLRWDDFRRFKYQVEVDGHGYQASLLAKMLIGSVVITQKSHWKLWFDDALIDGVHVVRTKSDLSDLPEKIEWLRANDAQARNIARRGSEVARALLDAEHVTEHMAALLARYKTLFTDAPPRLSTLFAALCASGERTCSSYNRSVPPPRFASIASHRHSTLDQRWRVSNSMATERMQCPTPHFSDSKRLQCDGWCKQAQRHEHCTWCKCAACTWCGGNLGSTTTMEVLAGFGVA